MIFAEFSPTQSDAGSTQRLSMSHHAHTWPRLPGVKHRVACHFCDTLHEVLLVEEGLAAHCQQCQAVLYRNRPNSIRRAIAFGITALCLITLVLIFPFITMDAQGNITSVSVPGAVRMLWSSGGPIIAITVAIFVIVLPVALIFGLLYLCIPLTMGKCLPGSAGIMRWFLSIQPWVMVEVFFLGTIISLLKLVKLADIELEIGFWSVAGLMICIAGAVGGIDKIELWDRIELAKSRRKGEA